MVYKVMQCHSLPTTGWCSSQLVVLFLKYRCIAWNRVTRVSMGWNSLWMLQPQELRLHHHSQQCRLASWDQPFCFFWPWPVALKFCCLVQGSRLWTKIIISVHRHGSSAIFPYHFFCTSQNIFMQMWWPIFLEISHLPSWIKNFVFKC